MAVLTGALPPRGGGDDRLELETDRTHRGKGDAPNSAGKWGSASCTHPPAWLGIAQGCSASC